MAASVFGTPSSALRRSPARARWTKNWSSRRFVYGRNCPNDRASLAAELSNSQLCSTSLLSVFTPSGILVREPQHPSSHDRGRRLGQVLALRARIFLSGVCR